MKKTISLLLALLMVLGLVACGGDDSSTAPSAPSTPSEAGSEPEELPMEEDAVVGAFLTGLEKGSDYQEGKRITAVMVNNIAGSRPTSGLSEAKVLTEIVTEGGISRFMALYDQEYSALPRIGSVRSARDQFVQLLIPFWGFLVHDGASTPAAQMLKDYEYSDFDLVPNTGSTFRRDRPGMKREYTEYTDGEHLASAIESGNFDTDHPYNSPMFDFVPYNQEKRVLDKDGKEVLVIHSDSYRTLMQYDDASGKYMMSQFSSSTGNVSPTIDENNDTQVSFDNLLVLFAPMEYYPGTELTKVHFFGGAGYYFNGGKYEQVQWRKGGPQEPLRILNFDGSEESVQLNPGTTYLAMVNENYLPEIDAALVSGTAAEGAAAGETNSNEVETED